ncbi:MAG: 4-(cytidine 5'-diphospho)-2-C-methyl-D-erythritol kinase [Cocleimonas sp.]|nr:4-(cytidine 5'-diphospho)-2-C-methyl-D-erythritol kinase [Cocleimonas sp.]
MQSAGKVFDISISTLVLPAPAKLNLFLHITGRRDDGYHLLQTVFQFLDYSDNIQLSLRNDGVIQRVKGLEHIPPESDLCVRAAKLLQAFTQSSLGVDLSIEKKLPIGGGIGGGSSDAATVLQGLNKLWSCGLSDDELAELGLQLGADVPVFIRGFSAWAEGVGEQLTPIALDEKWFLVIQPKISVSTAEIFIDKALTRDCEALKIARFLKGESLEKLINVFEPVVRNIYPEIAQALDWLSQFSPSRLTGTGACLFASFESEEKAKQVLDQLPKKWQGFVAKGLNESPLKSALLNFKSES